MGKRHSLKQIRAQRRAAPGCLGFTGCFGGSSHGFWEKFNLLVVRGSETQTEKQTWYYLYRHCEVLLINDQLEAMGDAGISAIALACRGAMR